MNYDDLPKPCIYVERVIWVYKIYQSIPGHFTAFDTFLMGKGHTSSMMRRVLNTHLQAFYAF